jgi:hypothetical protein
MQGVIIATSVSVTLSLIADNAISTENEGDKADQRSNLASFQPDDEGNPLSARPPRILAGVRVLEYDCPAKLGEVDVTSAIGGSLLFQKT